MPRRQYGTGSVYQRASDGRWLGAIQVGWTPRGTRRLITVSSAISEAEVKRLLKDKQLEIARNGVPSPGRSPTLKVWADDWLGRLTVRPKTAATYGSMVRRWIIPTIGRKRLDQLGAADVRAVATAMKKAKLSTSSARYAHTVLTKMLKDAVADGHHISPAVLVQKPPRIAVNDSDAIPTDQAKAILAKASELPDGSRWVAALLQGMRQGECLGLTWKCVDLDAATVDVSWQLQAIPFEHGCAEVALCVNRPGHTRPGKPRRPGSCRNRKLKVPDGYEVRQLDGALCLVRPKTSKGQRIIPLVPWMTAALRAWYDRAPESPHGLVWPRPNGRPQTSDADREAWNTLQETIARHPAGRQWHLHEARHTTATLLLEAGIDPVTVTAILGHSSMAASRGYQHVRRRWRVRQWKP